MNSTTRYQPNKGLIEINYVLTEAQHQSINQWTDKYLFIIEIFLILDYFFETNLKQII